MNDDIQLSIIMPAYNEAEIISSTLAHVVEGVRARAISFEVIVVENGSTDSTWEIVCRRAAETDEIRAERLSSPDYGAALRHGLLQARGETVVNFDVDYFDLSFLDAARCRLDEPDHPAIVVGSKRAAGSADTRPFLRRMVTRVFALILSVGFGLGVSDTHGMKAMRRAEVVPIGRRCRFGTDLFDTELILRAERRGLAAAEIPVTVVELRPARTSILRRGARSLIGLARLRVSLWRERP